MHYLPAYLALNLLFSLPMGITFGGWVEQNGALEEGGVISWAGNITGAARFVFTATVDMVPDLYGETITNTVEVSSANAGSGSGSAAVAVGMPLLNITKTVEAERLPLQPGDPITYTLVVRNEGPIEAVAVHIWDELPEGLVGAGVDITVTIKAGAAYTVTLPVELAIDAERGIAIENTAYFASGKLSGEDTVSFLVGDFFKLYLPIIMKPKRRL